MSSYFPIPNNFLVSSRDKTHVKCSLKLFNYPNNVSSKAINNSFKKKDIFFSIYKLKDYKWIKISDKKCEYGESCEFKREDLDLTPKCTAVIIPSPNTNNPYETEYLPKPYSLRVDKSPINERASYNFHLKNVSTSYQGEYPFELSKYGKTFFASDILRNDFIKESKTYVILMNIDRSSKLRNDHQLDILSFKTGKIIQKYFVKTNSLNAYLLPKKKSTNKLDHFFLRCKTTSFIPIFINVNLDSNHFEISAEHTHPPHELFLGEDRFKVVTLLKKNWLN